VCATGGVRMLNRSCICGAPIVGSYPNRLYCSARCRNRQKERRDHGTIGRYSGIECEQCRGVFDAEVRPGRPPRRCPGCSASCSIRYWSCQDCGLLGVAPASDHRRVRCSACARHARNGTRLKTRRVRCKGCAREFVHRASGRAKRFCSPDCLAACRNLEWPRPTESSVPWASCLFCRRWFSARRGRFTCPQRACVRRRERSKRVVLDAKRRLSVRAGEDFSRQEIFERDRWRCGLCGKRVREDLDWPKHGAPSIDHVIPLSRGGEHTRQNVQLAHLGCNWSKNGRVAGQGEQLALARWAA
jgi:hypothetical protein